ncbi:MAG: hypothetical protein K9W43_04215 [Candidatus Thorarchaeota archaeon]|nr:hypothetical protein [Candidatus Thorarchaeota archaeon]
MDPLTNTIFLAIFLLGLLMVIVLAKGGIPGTPRAIVANARPAKWKLHDFINARTNAIAHHKYIFTEQVVTNMTRQYRGRFDHAILRMEEGPVLDAIIEFKFPQNHIPYKVRKEDIFQAGLYALAFRDMGVSTRNTALLVVYCLQDNARRCGKPSVERCISCSKGRTFKSRFREHEVSKILERMEPYWLGKRRPIPSPSRENCRQCPYSKGKCQYSAV